MEFRNYVSLFMFLCYGIVQAAVRIVEIENHTPNGFYAIDISPQNRVIITPGSSATLDDLLGFDLHKETAIASIQGGYDPIYIGLHQNVFKCDQAHGSYVFSLWMGPQIVFENQKTLIPVCCKTDAAFRLVIHKDGTPEIEVASDAYFM